MRLEIDVIRTIEECGLAAWPAVERVRRHGWELRYSGGRSRRANAATPVEPAWSFDAVRAETERFYAQRGQAAVIRITPLAPPEADAALEAAGYTREDSNIVMTRGLVRPVADPGAEVQFEGTAEAGWREGSAGAQGLTPDEVQARDGIVARITPAATFVTVRADTGNAAPLGYGLGVVENGWVGLFAVVTAPQARR